jgi:hypothetical protein
MRTNCDGVFEQALIGKMPMVAAAAAADDDELALGA